MEIPEEEIIRINKTLRDLQLKNQALRESLSKAAGEHADEVSDLRVEVTNLRDELAQAQKAQESDGLDETVYEITDVPVAD